MSKKSVAAVDVYAEGRRKRDRVGRLERFEDPDDGAGYRFTYEDAYLNQPSAVSLGPELPLTSRSFFSRELFPTLLDRIPSRDNAAYPDYCAATGIDVDESDPFVLLTTIGRRGPSCFIFEPALEKSFGPEEAAAFRAELGLSLREFGILFDFSPYTIQKIESGRESGRDVLKRLELYVRFPEVAWFEILRNRPRMHTDLWIRMVNRYKEKGAVKDRDV